MFSDTKFLGGNTCNDTCLHHNNDNSVSHTHSKTIIYKMMCHLYQNNAKRKSKDIPTACQSDKWQLLWNIFLLTFTKDKWQLTWNLCNCLNKEHSPYRKVLCKVLVTRNLGGASWRLFLAFSNRAKCWSLSGFWKALQRWKLNDLTLNFSISAFYFILHGWKQNSLTKDSYDIYV